MLGRKKERRLDEGIGGEEVEEEDEEIDGAKKLRRMRLFIRSHQFGPLILFVLPSIYMKQETGNWQDRCRKAESLCITIYRYMPCHIRPVSSKVVNRDMIKISPNAYAERKRSKVQKQTNPLLLTPQEVASNYTSSSPYTCPAHSGPVRDSAQ